MDRFRAELRCLRRQGLLESGEFDFDESRFGFFVSLFFYVSSFSSVILLHFGLLPKQLLFCTWVMKWIEKTIEYSDSVPLGYVRL